MSAYEQLCDVWLGEVEDLANGDQLDTMAEIQESTDHLLTLLLLGQHGFFQSAFEDDDDGWAFDLEV